MKISSFQKLANIIIIITAIGMTIKVDPDSLLEEEKTMHVGGKEEEIKFCIQRIIHIPTYYITPIIIIITSMCIIGHCSLYIEVGG